MRNKNSHEGCMSTQTKNQVNKCSKKFKRPKELPGSAKLVYDLGLKTDAIVLALHLRWRCHQGDAYYCYGYRDLAQELNWNQGHSKIKECLLLLQECNVVDIKRPTKNGSMHVYFNPDEDEWVPFLREKEKATPISLSKLEDKCKNSCSEIATPSCSEIATPCSEIATPDTFSCSEIATPCSEIATPVHTYNKKEQERSKKEEIYKKEIRMPWDSDPETAEQDAQALLEDWRIYILENAYMFKVNACRVWGDGIKHAEAIAELILNGENINNIRMVFEYWKSGKSWFTTCLTPSKLISEKSGQTVYSQLFLAAQKELEKNGCYQVLQGIKAYEEGIKNGTLSDDIVPF